MLNSSPLLRRSIWRIVGSFNGPSPVCFLAQDVRSVYEGFAMSDEKMLTKQAKYKRTSKQPRHTKRDNGWRERPITRMGPYGDPDGWRLDPMILMRHTCRGDHGLLTRAQYRENAFYMLAWPKRNLSSDWFLKLVPEPEPMHDIGGIAWHNQYSEDALCVLTWPKKRPSLLVPRENSGDS